MAVKRVGLYLQIFLTVFCVAWLVHAVNWKAALYECLAVSPCMFILVFLQRCLPYLGVGWRLQKIFPARVNFASGLKASLLCVGCNNILPGRIGELVKIFWLNRENGIVFARLFSGVFLERLLDVSALLLLSFFFALPLINARLAAAMAILLLAGWLAAFWLAARYLRARAWLSRVSISRSIKNWLLVFLKFWAEKIRGGSFPALVIITALIWSMNYLHVILLTDGLMHMGLGWEKAGMLCVAVFFSSTLLLLPGGIGGMEAVVVMALGIMGIDASKAAAAAIFVRLFHTAPPLLGMLAVMISGKDGFVENLRRSRQRKILPIFHKK